LEKLGGRVAREETAELLVDRLCQDLLSRAKSSIADHGVFDLALSGGGPPQILFRRLVDGDRWRGFPWHKVRIWQVDERVVPHSDRRSNWRMIQETLISPLGLAEEQLNPMPVQNAAGDAEYEATLNHLAHGVLDYVLLGMGADGHTASLFPQSPALKEFRRLVVFNDGETVAEPRPRMTLTYPALRTARGIGALVIGSEKREILLQIVKTGAESDVSGLPILGVVGPELTWYVDGAALPGD
jgi:6-phosphogluconolactonase